jgi:hypothetical protein
MTGEQCNVNSVEKQKLEWFRKVVLFQKISDKICKRVA